MSMRDYAVSEYGLVLDYDALHAIATRIYDDCTDKAWDEDRWGFIEGVADTLDLAWSGEFTGEAFALEDDGRDDYRHSYGYGDDSIYYLPLKQPALFESPYKNMDELVDECRRALANFVPADFDFRKNIRHIVGTYFG